MLDGALLLWFGFPIQLKTRFNATKTSVKPTKPDTEFENNADDAADADDADDAVDDDSEWYITASEGVPSDEEAGAQSAVEEDGETTPVPRERAVSVDEDVPHTPQNRKRAASTSPEGGGPSTKQTKASSADPQTPQNRKRAASKSPEGGGPSTKQTKPPDAVSSSPTDDEDNEVSDDDDDVDEVLIGEIIRKVYQECERSSQSKVKFEEFYESHPEWHEFYTNYKPMLALLDADPRFQIAGDMVSLTQAIEEDEGGELVPGLDYLSSDDDDDSEDDDGEESESESTLEASIAIEDPRELFSKVKEALHEKGASVEAINATLEEMASQTHLDSHLNEAQHDQYRNICEEALKRVEWSKKPDLKPGQPGFNDFANSVLQSASAELVGDDFKMKPIDYRILTCSKCKKQRNVGAGPQFFEHTGSEWTCSRQDGGSCEIAEEPIDKELNLQPYQKTVEYLAHPFSPVQRLLVAHRTGAGKTVTMVRILDNYFYDPRPKIVILPTRSTVVNFYKELLRTRPNRYVDFARACAEDADHKGARGASLMDREDDDAWQEQLKHMCTVFKMRKFFKNGHPNMQYREKWLKDHEGVPLPAAPIVILSYARAGGESVLNRSLYEFRLKVKDRGGAFKDGNNPYNDKIVLCDEVHNLTMFKPELKRYKEKFKFLEGSLKAAKGLTLVGLTATPVKECPNDAKALLDVIKGDVSGRKFSNEGFVSYFGANPPSLFPKVEPEGAPSYSLPDLVYVPLTMPMRKRYLKKEAATMANKRLESCTEKEKQAKLSATLAQYCNMQHYFGRTHIEIAAHKKGGSEYLGGVLDALSPELAAKLDRIAEDVLDDWGSSDESNNKSIVLIDRQCGFEALFLLLRKKAEARGGTPLDPCRIQSFPPVKKGSYLRPTEIRPRDATKVLDDFNDLGNSNGKVTAVLVVDAREAAEGVSFKAVQTMYMANPPSSWLNYQQLAGRAVRAFSHNALDEHRRKVQLKMYVGTMPQHAASCSKCMGSCNGSSGELWFCSACSQFYCSKECKKEGHGETCQGKPGKMEKRGLEAIKTADEKLMEDLQQKLANEPPLRKLELVAVDRGALLLIDEINEHATAFAKIVREAKIRKINKRKRDKEEKEAREAKEKTEEELTGKIDALQQKVKAQDEQLCQSRQSTALEIGRCFTCTETKEVVKHAKCDQKHAMCVECFEFQFELRCKDSASKSLIIDKISCAYSGRPDGECKNGWTFSEALDLVSEKRFDALRTLHWECQKEQIEQMKVEKNDLEAKRLELKSAIGVKCPEYWTTLKSIPADLSKLTEPFSEIDVTDTKPFERSTITMKQQVQDIIDGLCIRGALGRGVDQKEKQRYTRMQVQKVIRVENPFLWMRYQSTTVNLRATKEMLAAMQHLPPQPVDVKTAGACEQLMRKNKLRAQLQEVYLFHG